MRQSLFIAVTLVLLSSLASAGSKSTPTTVSLVNAKLIQPLASKDLKQSKYSRARLPPSERRVRVLDQKPQRDSAGDEFFAFAVDARHGWGNKDEASWDKAAITGCVYPERGEVFIKRGKAFHPAQAATGKKTKAAPSGTCHGAAQLSAR